MSAHFVRMKLFGSRLRERAKALGISNAEAGRRVGLAERRYTNYVTGDREPDLGTLVHIAKTLETSADWLLGLSDAAERSQRQKLLDRLNSAARALQDSDLETVTIQTEALAASRKPPVKAP